MHISTKLSPHADCLWTLVDLYSCSVYLMKQGRTWYVIILFAWWMLYPRSDTIIYTCATFELQLYSVFKKYAKAHPQLGLTIHEFRELLVNECCVSN